MTNFLKTEKTRKDLERQKSDYDKNTKSGTENNKLDISDCSKVEMLEKISGYWQKKQKAELVESMKAEGKTKAQAHVQSIWKKLN